MNKWINLLAILFPAMLCAQSPSKFGKLSASDLGKKTHVIDTGANAVVLFDVGSTGIIGNSKGWFSLEFKRHCRIHILNKNGYGQATIEIPLYTEGDDEELLDDIKASSYNLENGNVVEMKLDKASIYKERKSKNLVLKKFTFPNVKEGTIIEYEYKIQSDFLFNLQPWMFQREIPTLWSEYKVALPQFLNYILISQGNLPFTKSDQKDKRGNYTVDRKVENSYGVTAQTEKINISCGITEFSWVIKEVPALQEQNFTSTIRNYVQRLEFQLAAYKEPLQEQKVLNTWPELARKMLGREDFGAMITGNNWLGEYVDPLVKGATTDLEKATRIYNYIRDQFACVDYYQLYADQTLRSLLKNKKGGVAEINLLLVAMLRYAGIMADPVILSTRSNGFTYPRYPIIGRFNYVIARAMVNGNTLFADATQPGMGLGRLTYHCYNGMARVINESAAEVMLLPGDLEEQETSIVSFSNTNGNWLAQVEHRFGQYHSDDIRKSAHAVGKESLLRQLTNETSQDVTVTHATLDSLTGSDGPVIARYKIPYKTSNEDLLYVNPIVVSDYRTNPFKYSDRKYPIEMPYKKNQTYKLSMEIPAGYVVDEMPKPLTIKLNPDAEVVFTYRIMQLANKIEIETQVRIDRCVFDPEEYSQLRAFFDMVVKKQQEQIVFRKAKE